MMQKNEKMKKAIIEKVSLFLNNKYRHVFQDKGFTQEILKSEVSKLIPNRNLKAFNFAERIILAKSNMNQFIWKKLTIY